MGISINQHVIDDPIGFDTAEMGEPHVTKVVHRSMIDFLMFFHSSKSKKRFVSRTVFLSTQEQCFYPHVYCLYARVQHLQFAECSSNLPSPASEAVPFFLSGEVGPHGFGGVWTDDPKKVMQRSSIEESGY